MTKIHRDIDVPLAKDLIKQFFSRGMVQVNDEHFTFYLDVKPITDIAQHAKDDLNSNIHYETRVALPLFDLMKDGGFMSDE